MSHRVALLVRIVLVVVVTCAAAADTGLPIDTRSLVEVRTLAAFPRGVNSALGRQKAGLEGIADVRPLPRQSVCADGIATAHRSS